jgi:hypothetical protein
MGTGECSAVVIDRLMEYAQDAIVLTIVADGFTDAGDSGQQRGKGNAIRVNPDGYQFPKQRMRPIVTRMKGDLGRASFSRHLYRPRNPFHGEDRDRSSLPGQSNAGQFLIQVYCETVRHSGYVISCGKDALIRR